MSQAISGATARRGQSRRQSNSSAARLHEGFSFACGHSPSPSVCVSFSFNFAVGVRFFSAFSFSRVVRIGRARNGRALAQRLAVRFGNDVLYRLACSFGSNTPASGVLTSLANGSATRGHRPRSPLIFFLRSYNPCSCNICNKIYKSNKCRKLCTCHKAIQIAESTTNVVCTPDKNRHFFHLNVAIRALVAKRAVVAFVDFCRS